MVAHRDMGPLAGRRGAIQTRSSTPACGRQGDRESKSGSRPLRDLEFISTRSATARLFFFLRGTPCHSGGSDRHQERTNMQPASARRAVPGIDCRAGPEHERLFKAAFASGVARDLGRNFIFDEAPGDQPNAAHQRYVSLAFTLPFGSDSCSSI